MLHGKQRRGLDKKLQEFFAYAARYGNQSIAEMKELTIAELTDFVLEISNIVKQEKAPRG